MKKTTKRNLTVILGAIILASTLSSCGQADKEPSAADKPSPEQQIAQVTKPNSETSTKAPTGTVAEDVTQVYQDINKESYEEQIKYYMELTESLQAELLKLKEEAYIDECEYQLQITSLEQTVQNLKDMIAAIQNSETKLPVSNNNTTPDKVVAKTDFKYTTENGQVTITGYNGTNIDIEIPSNIDGLPVTSVGEEAFKNAMIRSVIIPSSVREIGWFAFSGCTCLESVNIPSSVLSIEYGTFDYCPKTMTVNCEKGSYAEAYALSWGIKVSAQ